MSIGPSNRFATTPLAVAALAFVLVLLCATSATAQSDARLDDGPIVLAQAGDEAGEDGDDEGDAEASEGEQTTSSLQRGGRMEFDTRLVRGERAGSGAVFLFQRPPRALPSMIDRRSSYLDGTVHQVFGPEGVERLNESRNKE